jgi:hypothetical protein
MATVSSSKLFVVQAKNKVMCTVTGSSPYSQMLDFDRERYARCTAASTAPGLSNAGGKPGGLYA